MSKRPGSALKSSSDVLTRSHLLPIISHKTDIAQKAFLIPVLITVTFVAVLFYAIDKTLQGEPQLFCYALSVYLALAGYYFTYLLCGKRKPWWLPLAVALCTMLVLASPLLPLFAVVFRGILPGSLGEHPDASFLAVLIGHFFGAGLMEELIKAIPVLALLWLGMRLRSPWREQVGVWEPLDGILLGAASAVGFTLLETLWQYVPQTVHAVGSQLGMGAGYLVGLQLLIPRMLGSLFGHMAYSGYLGYFIGLAVLHPTYRWQILLVGYITAAGLHALWNSSGSLGMPVMVGVGGLSYGFLAAAILKARQISPNRAQNFATQVISTSSPANPGAGGVTAPPVRQADFSLQIGKRTLPLHFGALLQTREIHGLRALSGDGVVAEVNRNPGNPAVLGIRNLSQQTWWVTLPDGKTRRIDPGRSIRLEVGTRIEFGALDGEIGPGREEPLKG